jgi:FOG: HEAT repeat
MLGRTNDARAVEPLCGALNDENYIVRGAAARALGNLGSPIAAAAIPPLVKLTKDAELFVGKEAHQALLRLAGNDTVEVFISLLDSDDSAVRRAVVPLLSKINSSEAHRALLPLLGDNERDVRDATVESVKGLPEPEIEQIVSAALSRDDNPLIQRTAVQVIGELGQASYLDLLGDVLARDDVDPDVKNAAAAVITSMKDQLNIPDLVTRTGSANRQVRNRAIRLLALHGGKEAIDALLALLGNPDRYVRRQAVYALGDVGAVRAIPALEALLQSEKDDRFDDRFSEEIRRTIRKLKH